MNRHYSENRLEISTSERKYLESSAGKELTGQRCTILLQIKKTDANP
jgi:hypothetical protein